MAITATEKRHLQSREDALHRGTGGHTSRSVKPVHWARDSEALKDRPIITRMGR